MGTLFSNSSNQAQHPPSEQDEDSSTCSSLPRRCPDSPTVWKLWGRISSPTTKKTKLRVIHKMQDRADHNLGHRVCGDSRECVQHRVCAAVPDAVPAEVPPHHQGSLPDRQ